MIIKKINRYLLGVIFFFCSIFSFSTTHSLSGTTGFCALEFDDYTNDLEEIWYINTTTFQSISINYDINSEQDYDLLRIYSVSETGIETLLLETSGMDAGSLSTGVASGRAKIEFVSDGSVSYADGRTEYSGFYLEFSVSAVNQNVVTNGNASIAGNLGVGFSNPATRLHVNGPIRGNGSNGELTISTTQGSMTLGANSSTQALLSTDRSRFYMTKPLFLGTGALSASSNLSLQTNGVTRMTVLNSNGNVGIGTSNPLRRFDLRGEMYIKSDDYTTRPGLNTNHIYWYGHQMMMGTPPDDYAHNVFILQPGGADQGALYSSLQLWNANSKQNKVKRVQLISDGVSFINGGNVGIGTETPEYLLDVKGTIRGTEILVESVDHFADYVFEEGYRLPSLDEVNVFIQEKGHLPDIPSAQEVQTNGLNLVEMQVKLLKKIEELTLYAVDQHKMIELQQKRIEQLERVLLENTSK